MLPVKGGRVYWFATSNAPEGQSDPAGDRATQLLSYFKGWHEPIEGLIRAAAEEAILRNDIYDRDPLGAWGQGRVTLLGDAAHPMTPNLGQGGCQAIEDAMEFAAQLSAATHVEAGLRSYESRRIARTSSIVMASRRVGAMGQIESPLLCRLRDFAVRLTPSSVSLRSLATVAAYEGHLTD